MNWIHTLLLALVLLGCQRENDEISYAQLNVIPEANSSDTIVIHREDTANGYWGSATYLFGVDANPAVYSDNITVDFLGLDNMPIPQSLLTGSVAAYAGAKTQVTATAALHAYPLAAPGIYKLRITVQSQKASSTLFRPVIVL